MERDDLDELLARRALTEDAARPEAVERRHAGGGRTARENIADLVDPGSLRRVRALRDRRPARAARPRGPDRAHARPTAWSAGRRASTASFRRARRLRRALLRLHGAGRDPGRARPPQEGPAVRADRADAAADRLLRRGRRRAARATPTTRSSRRSTRARSRCGRGSPGSCRGSRSSRAAASPATR